MTNPSHVIFLEWPLGRNSGGPAGYLWHLKQGLEAVGLASQVAFITPKAGDTQSSKLGEKKKKWGNILATVSGPFWRVLKTYGPTRLARDYKQILSQTPADYAAPAEWEAILADKSYTSFHCHTTLDCLKVDNSLKKLGRRQDVTLYLTSHCPEMPAFEKRDILAAFGLTRKAAKRVTEQFLAIDLAAFTSADYLIFPCAEALEPYLETYPPIEAVFKSKKILYLLTGIEKPVCSGKPVSFPGTSAGRTKMLYIGRHNTVKGYDRLCRVVPRLLDTQEAAMVVAGSQGPLFPPLHPHWHELGWISNGQDVMANADVLLLPNTRTYFDLIALEALALGIPIIASATGGNKKLATLSPGIVLFDSTDTGLESAIERFLSLCAAKRAELGKANAAAYERYCTSQEFAASYVDVIKESI